MKLSTTSFVLSSTLLLVIAVGADPLIDAQHLEGSQHSNLRPGRTGKLSKGPQRLLKNADLPQGKPFQDLQGQIYDLSQSLEELEEEVADLEARVTQNAADIIANADIIADNTADIEGLLGDIETLGQSLSDLANAIVANEEDIEAKLLALTGSFETYVAAQATAIGALEARIASNEDDIDAIWIADQAMQATVIRIETLFENRIFALETNSIQQNILLAQIELNLAQAQADLESKQERISSACPAGSAIRQVDGSGTVQCQVVRGGTVFTASSMIEIPVTDDPYRVVAYGVICPSGTQVVGGGYHSNTILVRILYSYPFTGTDKVSGYWVLALDNTPGVPNVFTVYARCLNTMLE